MTSLEVIGTVFALLGVWLTARQYIWCWPVSIIAIVIYIYIFFKSALYGDSGLQVFYLVMSFYGWYEWKYAGNKQTGQPLEKHLISSDVKEPVTELQVSQLGIKAFFITNIIGIVSTVILVFVLKKTNTNVPWLDAGTTAFSLIATWMTARKILQNWIYWIAIDTVYIGIYIYKGLYVTSVQYFIFTLLAAYGYWEWKKQWQRV